MGSSSNSSRPAFSESVDSRLPLSTGFFEEIDDALAQVNETLHVFPAVADEHGELQVLVDPKYLLRPPAPQGPLVQQANWDEIYEKLFRRLELEYPHVPLSVTEGNVATMSLESISAGGELGIESVLEKHVAGLSK